MDTGTPAGTFGRTRTRTRKNRTRVRVGSKTRTGYPRDFQHEQYFLSNMVRQNVD